MGLLGKFVLLSIILTAVGIGYIVNNLKEILLLPEAEIPELRSTWWGPGQPRKVDESIRKFKIDVPSEVMMYEPTPPYLPYYENCRNRRLSGCSVYSASFYCIWQGVEGVLGLAFANLCDLEDNKHATFSPLNEVVFLYGVHSTLCFSNSLWTYYMRIVGSFFPSLVVDDANVDKMYPLGKVLSEIMLEMGYMHLQATKPDTVGVALRDSPVGLAAYILEKFSTWTNKEWRTLSDGGLTIKYSLTDLLDNIMIYWVTGSITTSMRLYSETFNKANQFALQRDSLSSKVPTSCAMFPNEVVYTSSESLLKDKYPNLVRFTNMERGGHFAAFEEPELLADDVWETVKIVENIRKTV